MIGDALSIIFVLSPGLIGFLCGVTLAQLSKTLHSISLLLGAVGGLLGYMALALFIYWRDALGLHAFFPNLGTSLLGLLLSTTACCIFAHSRHCLRFKDTESVELGKGSHKAVAFVVSFILVMTVVQVLLQVSVSPLSSWDALDLWAGYAEWILRYELDPEGYRGITRDSYGTFPWFHERHPATVYYISAFSGFAMEGTNSIRGWLVPWSFIWLCGALVVWGFVHSVSRLSLLSAFAMYCYCALPLYENHASLVGYADAWVNIAVITATALLSLALYRKSTSLLIVGMLLSLLPIAFKNTGALYTASVMLPLVIIQMVRLHRRLLVVLILSALVAGVYFIRNGFDIYFGKNRYAFIVGDSNQLLFGGYTMMLDISPLTDLLVNYSWALFINQSFSVVVLMGALGGLVVATRTRNMSTEAASSLSYLLLVSAFILIAFSAPQLLSSEYARIYATPSSDLGNSRFVMSFGPILLMTLAFLPYFHRVCGEGAVSHG